MTSTSLFMARWVLPMTAPPQEFGAVELNNERIVAVLSAQQAQERINSAGETLVVRRFPNAILLPGLINLHTHLEWTRLHGLDSDSALFDWIEKLVAASRSWGQEQFLLSAVAGVQHLINSGTSCVLDSSYSGKAALALSQAGLRGVVALELFGLDESKAGDSLKAWHEKRASVLETGSLSPLVQISIAPHAPYSVSVPLLHIAFDFAEQQGAPPTMHVSESRHEFDWFNAGDSRLDAFLEKLHRLSAAQVPFRGSGKTPVTHLADNGLLNSSLVAAHAVHLTDTDIAALKNAGTKVASCPRSNARLRDGAPPLRRLIESGLTVGFGTDSLASNDDLDILAEARFAYNLQRAVQPDFPVSAEKAIRQLTIEAAQALGLQAQIGSLEPGKQADIAIFNIDFSGDYAGKDPYDALLYGHPVLNELLVAGVKVGPKSLY